MVKLVGGVVSALVCLGACGSSEEKTDQTGVETGVEESGLETADPQMGHPTCEALELPTMAWNPGPYGMLRHDIADDFDFPVLGGETWSLSANWTGCDVYLFVPRSVKTKRPVALTVQPVVGIGPVPHTRLSTTVCMNPIS